MGYIILISMAMKVDFNGCRRYEYKPNTPKQIIMHVCKWDKQVEFIIPGKGKSSVYIYNNI